MRGRLSDRSDSGRASLWLLAAILCLIALTYGACRYLNSATEKYAAYVRAVSTFSNLAGISTEDMSRLLHAASVTGTDPETLVQGLIGFRRSVLEANAGQKRRVEAFRRIRIGRVDLADGRKNTVVVFWKFTDQVHNLGSNDDKAWIVREILGPGSLGLIPFLSRGSPALRELGADVDGSAKLVTNKNVLDAAQLKAAQDMVDEHWRDLLRTK
jgi:hypothetical protein